MREVSDVARRARLADRHRLLPSTRIDDVPTIVDSMVALHSSDPVTVHLSVAARSNGISPADVERALYDERTIVRHHAMRRTLWVTTTEVAELVHAACTRKIAAAERTRTAGYVGDAAWLDAAVDQVVEFVRTTDVAVSTRRIGEALPALRREIVMGAGTRHEVTAPAHPRVVLIAAFDGFLVRDRPAGTWVGSQYGWEHIDNWPGIDWARHDELSGMTGVVERWLRSFGPGTLTDLVWWTGSTKTLIRRALAELDVEEVALADGVGYLLADDEHHHDFDDLDGFDGGAAAATPWVAVLPGLDPTAMGWKERAWYLDANTARRVVDRFGNIGPTIWADGRIVGGWAQRPDGELAVELTTDVGARHRELIDAELARLAGFIGDTRFKVRFPSPNQRQLLG